MEYEFYTAWSPPIEFLKRVAVQWPALIFVLAYEEPGMAFKGVAKFQGEINEDHCISLTPPDPKELIWAVPATTTALTPTENTRFP